MGPLEIILIVLALVLIFGARKIPELGKGFGQGIREFRRGVKEDVGEGRPDAPAKPEDRA